MQTETRDYKKDWEDFWKEIVTDEDGNVDLDQIQKELSDYSYMLEEVPKVYCAITNNTLSKPFYKAETVITMAQDIQTEEYKDWFKDEVEEIVINITAVLSAADSSDYRSCLYETLAKLTNKNVDDLTEKSY